MAGKRPIDIKRDSAGRVTINYPDDGTPITEVFALNDAIMLSCLSEKGCVNWLKQAISKRATGEIRTRDGRDLSGEVAMYERVLSEVEEMLKRQEAVQPKE